MTSLLALFTALVPLAQDPPPAKAPAAADVVVLRSGEELHGTVLIDTKDYLQIQMGSDTVIGMARSEVVEVRKGAAPVPAAPAAEQEEASPAAAPVLASRDEWFVLHDGEGRCVGTLHATLRGPEPDGSAGIRLAEEWDFVTERGRTQVTRLETLAEDGTPSTCFYHERTQHPGERHPRDERLVRGTYAEGVLKVVRTTDKGSEHREYSVGPGLAFPLHLHELLRQRPGLTGSQGARVVYDSATEELIQRPYRADVRRRVEIDGRQIDVREASVGVGPAARAEWIDGNGRVVRREVSGPALVAVRAARDVAEAMVERQAKAYPAAVQREAEGRFSFWLPNPIWRFDADQEPGQVSATAPIYEASACAMLLDQFSPATHLATAADGVERWLRAVCRGFELRARGPVEVRGQSGFAVEGAYQRSLGGRQVRCEVLVIVLRARDERLIALCFAAPANDFDALRPDFDRMVESLELHPAAVAAEARPGRRKLVPGTR